VSAGLAWAPTPASIERANVSRFMRAHGIESLAEPTRRSVGDVEWFWNTVREHLGAAFTPRSIVFAPALPKTRSAKIVRRAVRAALAGEDPGDLSSIEDPSVLEAIGRRPATG
jgi:acyl-CoA synthetase (AMP-forming)/AMP-acid ligase II